ncbi:hypothetical protein [Microbacterium aureliae]
MRRVAPAVAALVLAAAPLAGCDGAASPAASDDAPLGERVQVTLVQLRGDVAARQAQVQVVNVSETPVTVGDVAVVDQRFDREAVRVIAGGSSEVAPGGRVDVRVHLPQVDCTAPHDGEPRVRLALAVGGRSEVVTVPAGDPLGFVAPLHERECRAMRVFEAAELSFAGFDAAAPGDAAALRLRIAPVAAAPGAPAVTIEDVQPTNLLEFAGEAPGAAHPIGVRATPGAASVEIVLPIVPSRCDPHAVQEDKRGTIFDVRVVVDGDPGEIELFVGETLRGRILSWVADWCGFGR